jgi:hypothetical protein
VAVDACAWTEASKPALRLAFKDASSSIPQDTACPLARTLS